MPEPTPWVDGSAVAAKLTEGGGITPEAAQQAAESATEVLYELSGRRYGIVEDEIRPYGHGPLPSYPPVWGETIGWDLGSPVFPYDGPGPDAGILDLGEIGCSCGAGQAHTFPLPGRVDSVLSILIDGQPFTSYLLADHKALIRTDGDLWPACQDLTLDPSQVGTWWVSYRRGLAPTNGAVNACLQLATELAKYDNPALAQANGGTRMPSNTTSVSQQGVTMSFMTVADMMKLRITGISSVDSWLAAVNPDRRSGASTVSSPDITRKVRRYS